MVAEDMRQSSLGLQACQEQRTHEAKLALSLALTQCSDQVEREIMGAVDMKGLAT
jgi:hypothetical protein